MLSFPEANKQHVSGICIYGYNYIFRDQTKLNRTNTQRQTDSSCTNQTPSHFRENKITAAINSSRNSSHLHDMKETIKGPSFDVLLQPKSTAEVHASAGPMSVRLCLFCAVAARVFTWEVLPWQQSHYLHFKEKRARRPGRVSQKANFRSGTFRLLPVRINDTNSDETQRMTQEDAGCSQRLDRIAEIVAKPEEAVTGDRGCSPHVWLSNILSSYSSLLRLVFGTTYAAAGPLVFIYLSSKDK